MAGERPEAAYAARLLERQDALQAEADRLVDRLDLGASCGRLSPGQAWETMLPLAAHMRTTRMDYRNETGRLTPPELQGYGRYYFVVWHEADAGDEWKIDVSLWSPEAPPGPLVHAQELRRRPAATSGAPSQGRV